MKALLLLFLAFPVFADVTIRNTNGDVITLADGDYEIVLSAEPAPEPEPPVHGEPLVILCVGMSNASNECDDWRRRGNTTRHEVINAAWSGRDYYRLQQPGESEDFWTRAATKLANRNMTFADVDVVYNKNTLSYNNGPQPADSVSFAQRIDDLESGLIWFQSEAEARIPNMLAGYHGIRSNGEWCEKSPQDLADATPTAINVAITYSSKWHVGPDLSTPNYVREDFVTDGCHPSTSGLGKITPIIDAFFSEIP